MKVTQELYEAIVCEIARLSMIIIEEETGDNAKGLAIIINHLAAVLIGEQTIDDFHDQISCFSQVTREFYYKLLYVA